MNFELLYSQLQQFYGAHCRAIDTGDGAAWAATFTPDGSYESPSYEAPCSGRESLEAFGNSFPQRTPNARHIVTNLHVRSMEKDKVSTALTFLIIAGDPGEKCTILRAVSAYDDLIITPEEKILLKTRRIEF